MPTPVKSTQSDIAASIPDAYFKSELLKPGDFTFLYRRFAQKEKLPSGSGKTWKANRMIRIEMPMDSLSEGVTPNDVGMTMEQVSCTAAQYGIVVTLTDVAQLTIETPLLQQAVQAVKDAMNRLDEELICEALLSGTNVVYADASGGASIPAARVDLAAADVFATETIKRIVNQLSYPTDVKWGAAPKFSNGYYVMIMPKKWEFDLLGDATWKDMAIRQGREDLEKGMVNRWLGVEFYTTDWGPKFTNLGTTDSNAAPTSSTFGVTVNEAALTGSFLANTTYDFKWTRRHKHRRFEEGISGVVSQATANDGVNTKTINVYAPTDTSYVYSLYQGASGGTLYRVASNVSASSITVLTTPATSGTAAPAHPNTGVSVYVGFCFGKGAYAVVDLDNMEAGLSKDERSDSDPLKQRRKVSAKFFEGAIILADNNLIRVEASSAF